VTRIPHPGKRRGGDDLGVHAAQQHGAVRADESEKQSRPVTRRNGNLMWIFSEATGVFLQYFASRSGPQIARGSNCGRRES